MRMSVRVTASAAPWHVQQGRLHGGLVTPMHGAPLQGGLVTPVQVSPCRQGRRQAGRQSLQTQAAGTLFTARARASCASAHAGQAATLDALAMSTTAADHESPARPIH